ncbi:MAG: hypothetical protein WCC11_01080 [Gammaproteobacteria bacterium]
MIIVIAVFMLIRFMPRLQHTLEKPAISAPVTKEERVRKFVYSVILAESAEPL